MMFESRTFNNIVLSSATFIAGFFIFFKKMTQFFFYAFVRNFLLKRIINPKMVVISNTQNYKNIIFLYLKLPPLLLQL
jgi:hypothetical protein